MVEEPAFSIVGLEVQGCAHTHEVAQNRSWDLTSIITVGFNFHDVEKGQDSSRFPARCSAPARHLMPEHHEMISACIKHFLS